MFAQSNNPYQSIGKKAKVLTLSKGQYDEFFDQDSIQQIGTALVNIRQMKVVKLYANEVEAKKHLDNSISSRFLSVDPLTSTYPMLTPYQYASNRPIDGIDLDGKEWTKVETYDPKTGVTNVNFQVKLKVLNESKVFTDVQSLQAEIQKQFAVAFAEVKNKQSKVSYSASINVEMVDKLGDHDFGALIFEGQKPEPGSIQIAGITAKTDTKENAVSATGSYFKNGQEIVKDAKAVAQDIVHELMHTGGVVHPQDDENTAQDVDLVPTFDPNGKFKTYVVGEGATLDLIISNIMVYGDVKIDNKKVKEYQPDKYQRNKVSPDQAKIISEQIDKDASKKTNN
jgi:hypothetical protein